MSRVAVRLTGQWSYLVYLRFCLLVSVVGTVRTLDDFQFYPPSSLLPSSFFSPSQIPCSTFPVTLFVSLTAKYLKVHVCCVTLKAMKMSRRSADASQRALAYSRMVDGLNEFRLGHNSLWLTVTHTIIFCHDQTYMDTDAFFESTLQQLSRECLSLQ